MARWDRTPPGARRYVRVLLPALLIGLSSCNSDSPTEPVAEDGLELSATSVRFTYLGEEVRLQAVLTPRRSDGSAVVAWASTDASVVTVTQGGLARAVGNGSARITASVAGQFGVVDIQVEQEAVFMTLPADSVTLAGPGAREVLEVEVLDAGGTPLTTVAEVRWSSNREEIVTVDGSGMLNAVSPGDAIVTAEAAGIGGGGLRHEVAVRVNDAIRVDGSAMTVDALGGRSRLRLSSGAVAGEVFLTFEPAPTLPERPATISGTALQITPVALEFSAPVTLSIEYDEAAVPAGVDEGELALHQLIGDDFVEVEGALLDADANVASGEIDGLGVFAIVRRLSVATPALPSGVVGAAYGVQRLVVGGGSGTTWWSLAAGSGPTPPGLTLFSDGTVSGVPSEGGSWTFVVEARSGGQTARRSYTISVAAPLEIITDSLPDATPSAPYTTSLGAAGGTGSYSWSHDPAAGPLPPGLQLSGNGVLSGTPTQSGAWTFSVQVGSGEQSVERTLSLTVLPRLSIATTTLTPGVRTQPYAASLSAAGGDGSYTWSVAGTSGPLPPGLQLSGAGTVSGVPTEVGSWAFVVEVRSGAQTAQKSFTLDVDAPLQISTSSLPDAAPTVAYSASLSATGGDGVYRWSLAAGSGALPPGLTLSAGGMVTGTPTFSGSWAFTVRVESRSQVVEQTLSITVHPNLAVLTTGLAGGVRTELYSATMSATGGTGAYAWTLRSGSGVLPPGLVLSGDGVISGVPSEVGSWTFVVEVRSGGQTAARSLTISVDSRLQIETMSMPAAAPAVTYSVPLVATGGNGLYAWSLAPSSGPLPPGLSLSTDGYVSGPPTESGSWSFTVRVESRGQVAQQTLSITVNPRLTLASASLAGGIRTVAYSALLSASGGTGPYSWTLAAGSGPLPPGLTLSGDGRISGTPTSIGSWSFSVRVASSDGQVAVGTRSIAVLDPLSVVTSQLSNGSPAVPYTESLEATGGSGTYAWRLAPVSGPLPPGLSLSSAGMITGTPGSNGSWSFVVQVDSDDGQSTQRALSITINSTLQVTTVDLPNGAPTIAYSTPLSATGGVGAYTWQLATGSGPLPPGLGLSTGGTISGTPTQNGSWTFTVQVRSGDGQTAQRQLSIVVQAPTANFTFSCTDLTCHFTDTSTDDGSVVAWSWTFGDGSSSTQRNPSRTYSAGGTYTVTLRVTDDLGAASPPTQRQVTVFAPPVLVGAGDIAVCNGLGDEATAALLDGISGTVYTTGDNAYPNGTASDFANCYAPSWGRHRSRTRPSAGNHDYDTPGGSAYYSYFGSRAGDPTKGYYSYDLGAWHIIVLNSNLQTTAGSQQLQWLQADLAANPRTCTLAYWHHARFSSGSHGNNLAMKPFWDVLYAAGADVILVGHDHDYERFARQTPSGVADPVRGIRQFVVGTGGSQLRGFGTIAANSEVRNSSVWGVLKLTLHQSRYEWTFVPTAGSTFQDSGSTNCH